MSLEAPAQASLARRGFCAGIAASAVTAGCTSLGRAPDSAAWNARLAALETRPGLRLGAHVLDLTDGAGFGWRQDERFGMCSGFKLSLAALVLREADVGRIDTGQRIDYTEADLLPASPVTRANLGSGMTIAALAEAAQTASDNAAANLLLTRLGGPAALTGFWRSIGDTASRLDRNEPGLNSILPGDPRDTTTPRAMAGTLRALFAGDALSPQSRALLSSWMTATQTGVRRIRAGLPAGWQAGDKTGTGLFEKQLSHYVDLAVMTAPSGRRIAVTGFVATSEPQARIDPELEAILARIGGIAADWALARGG